MHKELHFHINNHSNNPSRTYFVGQWLDVKDTVNQWLEATIMIVDSDQERLFIHYNGWLVEEQVFIIPVPILLL